MGSRRRRTTRALARGAALVIAVLALLAAGPGVDVAAAAPCDVPIINPVACENTKPGNPGTEWDLPGDVDDPTILGFTTEFSVNKGQTVRFKIDTDATAYRIDIYRMGYYNGDGARKVATRNPSVALPQTQPECLHEASTALVDCGNWAVSATWAVPTTAVSGIYFARLVRLDTLGASHVVFVVRDDAAASNILFQTADTTWQAYNRYGGASLYTGNGSAQGHPADRAYKVSYNRPFTNRDYTGFNWLFHSEYPMVRWLEANGYNVSYSSGIDTARRGAELLEHDVFMTSGHDEYWSGEQRANVEAARAAGVNLAFFSANDVYWKTRWEPSIDGSSTSHRTLVCYKETAVSTKLDPSPVWTGTWRDARHSPPSDGGRSEHSLLGTRFGVQFSNESLHIPAGDGKLRLWRNTSVADLAPGEVATVGGGVVGYEWNDVPDDNSRPPGLMRFSSTTLDVSSYLLDEGSAFGAARATHHLTMYKHPSGALVFSAATIQWPWALDPEHDGSGLSDPDPRIVQATVNLFADMGVQPDTPQAGVVPATASPDTLAPASTVTSPAAGATVPRGEAVTVTGTASDPGGGRVAGVEVSVDGGATWRTAQTTNPDGTVSIGRESWSYKWIPKGSGSATIRTRAVDDSGNIETPSAGLSVEIAGCPCSIWGGAYAPAMASAEEKAAIEVGVKFRSTTAGYITGIRFYKGATNTGTHVGHLWTSNGTLLGKATFINETATGWQQALLGAPVRIEANTTYVASYFAPNGHWARDLNYFLLGGFDSAPLSALPNTPLEQNGVYNAAGMGFPEQSYQASNYWVDVIFDEDGTDTVAPRVEEVWPVSGAAGVGAGTDVEATFTELVDPATVNGGSFELRDSSGALVPAAVSYDAASQTAKLNPAGQLALSATYTARVSGVEDLAGNPLTDDVTWSFTTATPADCPCSIWNLTAAPGTVAVSATAPHELGVKFRSDVSGFVTGVRFYKGSGNGGKHTGSLWSASGNLLGRVTFKDESAVGWQTAHFGAPIPVAAGETYVVSYFAPEGRWSRDLNYFASRGTDNFQLHALADGVDGGNGVYNSSGASAFPNQSYGAANYWVDVIFDEDATDNVPPQVDEVTPPEDYTSASTASAVTAVFSEGVDPATVNGNTFFMDDGAGDPVPATVSYDPATSTATLTPETPLSLSMTYTAKVESGPEGVRDPAGNALPVDKVWSFTTATPATCPCSIWGPSALPATASVTAADGHELGLRWRSDVDGFVTGIRFYKGSLNTGTHVGHLWTASGQLLSTATFTNETSGGWQEVRLPSPAAVEANESYVVSYWAPNGGWARTLSYFATAGYDNAQLHALQDVVGARNGVYRSGASGFPDSTSRATNYWVDVVFESTSNDTSAPSVSQVTPADGATEVVTAVEPTVQFNEPVDPATVSGSTIQLRDGGGALVPATVNYDAATQTAKLDPSAALTLATAYSARVVGGASGVKDLAGNALAADYEWSFTTAIPADCPCSIWAPSAVPATASVTATQPHELGVKLRSDVGGFIRAVRFYKGAQNTGTHRGSLWSSTGALLGRVTFRNETATGWQTAHFGVPVPVTAGTTYVASYLAPNGGWAVNRPYFDVAGVDNAPLHALRSGLEGGNGVYLSAAAGGFPTASVGASNYWVDVVFDEDGTDNVAPLVEEVAPASGATGVATTAQVTARFSEPVDPATVSGSTVELRTGGSLVAATVAYDAATNRATLTPSAPLTLGTTYTATVKGGASGVRDPAGNALASDFSWSFTTAAPAVCPCTIWAPSAVPATASVTATQPHELGVKFRTDVNGFIRGVRFYKGSLNTGTHVAHLWTRTGTLLATATFTGETATGWQEVSFAAPVPVTANTTYVASYFAPSGGWALNRPFFGNGAVDRPPLHALRDGFDGGNGVYNSGAAAFPSASFGGSNYWVDVVFTTS